jgi:hypothetical protein
MSISKHTERKKRQAEQEILEDVLNRIASEPSEFLIKLIRAKEKRLDYYALITYDGKIPRISKAYSATTYNATGGANSTAEEIARSISTQVVNRSFHAPNANAFHVSNLKLSDLSYVIQYFQIEED